MGLCKKSLAGAAARFEKGAGRSPAERPFRRASGTGGTSRMGFLHNPRARGCAPCPARRDASGSCKGG